MGKTEASIRCSFTFLITQRVSLTSSLTAVLSCPHSFHLQIEEMLEILAKDCPADESPAFFRAFVELLYGVFHHSCKNLNELRHMAELLFPKYREPVISGASKFAIFRVIEICLNKKTKTKTKNRSSLC